MKKTVRYLAWAWIIIIGALMFTPGGVACIKCGIALNDILALVSIVAGVAGIITEVTATKVTAKQ